MELRTVDPANWPLWPKGTLVAIELLNRPNDRPHDDVQIGRIVAVGELATLVTKGEANGRPVLFRANGVPVTVGGRQLWIVDEAAVLATLRD